MNYSLNSLYAANGVSKQSVHRAKQRQEAFDQELAELVVLADELKKEHPGCGVEKMYYTLQPKRMGRDKFCEIFLSLGYGVKRVKNYTRTTYRGNLYYPNLIEGMVVNRPYHVIQSDITYIRIGSDHCYLVFIIDVYTRLIVGYSANNHLRAEANVCALKMALKRMDITPFSLIHHSDKGSQYSSDVYTELLQRHGIHISMGDAAWENPFAERVNGIIKNEYLKRWKIENLAKLKRAVKRAVTHYNDKRKHRAFKMKYAPKEFKDYLLSLSPQERPKVIIYAKGKNTLTGTSSPGEMCPKKVPQDHSCPREINKEC